MAEEVAIVGTNAFAKRSPWGVFGLTLITGIYGFFWWYYVNKEMVELGRAKGPTSRRQPRQVARGALPGLPDHRAAAGLVLPRHAAHAGGRAAHRAEPVNSWSP